MKSIKEILNIKYPLFQGGMTMIANHKLVAAVSNAGALGILASSGLSKEELREEIQKIKKLTDKPFAVNLMLMNKNIDELIDVIAEEGVKIVSTGAGTPKPYMSKLKENNIKVIAVIPNVKVAKKMEELGVDILVAEGTESGGHVGETTTMTLVPQIVDAVNIPVVAAGGIADGRGLAAAFSLGAKGIQLGTVFLASKECLVPDDFKRVLVEASDTSTVVSSRNIGVPFRAIKNDYLLKYAELEKNNAEKEQLDSLKTKGFINSIINNNLEEGIVLAGQIAGLIKEVKPVKEIVENIFNEYNEIITKLPKL